MSIDPELLAILVCPATRGPLRHDEGAGELVSDAAGLAYPIRDGVPVLLVEEARPLNPLESPPPGP
jgi:uncharacterized protein YbaR (Trm112 family)